MRLGTALLLAMLCSATSANAAVMVIGMGPAHQCYLAAAHETGAVSGDDVCTAALNNGGISLRDRAATLINRGVIRTRLNRLPAALIDLDEAIAMGHHLSSSDLGVAFVDRASVLNGLGRHREALDSANKGLGLGASNAEIGYYDRAVAEEMLGDAKGAYEDYKKALAVKPDFAPAAQQLTRFRVVPRQGQGS